MAKYNIWRYFRNGKNPKFIKRVGSLKEAQTHCNDPATAKAGEWFDGYNLAGLNRVCSICEQPYKGYGNNAEPVNSGSCCDKCNEGVVIPIRMAGVVKNQLTKL